MPRMTGATFMVSMMRAYGVIHAFDGREAYASLIRMR